jgi:hypothetical protein
MPPVSKPLTMEQWYDFNLRDAEAAKSRSRYKLCRTKTFDRLKKPAYIDTEPCERRIPNATYPLVVTQAHKDSVQNEYNNSYSWDQKAVVEIMHVAKMGWVRFSTPLSGSGWD